MNSVIVGMFDSQAEATQAQTQLIAAGFSRDAVMMTGGGDTAASGTMATSESGVGSTVSGEAEHAGNAISRFFHHLFGSDDDVDVDRSRYTETYHEAFRRGSYGVSVSADSDDEIDRAERILNDAGAVDIDERASSWREEGWTGGSTAAQAMHPAAGYAGATSGAGSTGGASAEGTTGTTGATQKLQEVEEELKVGKRAVARGGLRVFKRLTERPVEETVRLREEHATIERRAVDRPATEADFTGFKEGSIEVRETGEEAVVSKTARVTGEVEIGKTVTEREEVVRDTVRKTQVEVEEIGEGGRAASGSTLSGSTGVSGSTGSTGMGGGTGSSYITGPADNAATSGTPGAAGSVNTAGTGVDTSTGTDLGSTSGTRMP